MKNRNNSYTLRAICLSLGAVALPAGAAPTNYDMNLTTHAGMGAGGTGFPGALFSGPVSVSAMVPPARRPAITVCVAAQRFKPKGREA